MAVWFVEVLWKDDQFERWEYRCGSCFEALLISEGDGLVSIYRRDILV